MTAAFSEMVPGWYRPPRHAANAVDTAARIFEVARHDLTGAARQHHICRARWAVMLVLQRRGYSTPRIGRALGGRDHTTIMHGLKRGAAIEAADSVFAFQVGMVGKS